MHSDRQRGGLLLLAQPLEDFLGVFDGLFLLRRVGLDLSAEGNALSEADIAREGRLLVESEKQFGVLGDPLVEFVDQLVKGLEVGQPRKDMADVVCLLHACREDEDAVAVVALALGTFDLERLVVVGEERSEGLFDAFFILGSVTKRP